jgi:transcriptional regulator with XRE-family HTH domain
MHHPRQVSAIDRKVAANLRRLRLQAGLTQTEIAEAIGVSFPQEQKYESGINRISASKLFLAARRIGCTLDELFEGADDSED